MLRVGRASRAFPIAEGHPRYIRAVAASSFRPCCHAQPLIWRSNPITTRTTPRAPSFVVDRRRSPLLVELCKEDAIGQVSKRGFTVSVPFQPDAYTEPPSSTDEVWRSSSSRCPRVGPCRASQHLDQERPARPGRRAPPRAAAQPSSRPSLDADGDVRERSRPPLSAAAVGPSWRPAPPSRPRPGRSRTFIPAQTQCGITSPPTGTPEKIADILRHFPSSTTFPIAAGMS